MYVRQAHSAQGHPGHALRWVPVYIQQVHSVRRATQVTRCVCAQPATGMTLAAQQCPGPGHLPASMAVVFHLHLVLQTPEWPPAPLRREGALSVGLAGFTSFLQRAKASSEALQPCAISLAGPGPCLPWVGPSRRGGVTFWLSSGLGLDSQKPGVGWSWWRLSPATGSLEQGGPRSATTRFGGQCRGVTGFGGWVV